MIPWLEDRDPLPPTRLALGPGSDAPGLLAASGTLDIARLDEAYRHGVFPWYSPGQPVLWWSPDPRMVLSVAEFRLPQSLRKTLRRFVRDPACEVRIDGAFDDVIAACAAAPRAGQHGTWIVPEMIAAYRRWHRAGRVHSFETWIDGRLAGGLYGVAIGRMFFGESMFARTSDASKVALAALVAYCREHRMPIIDCQQNTAHLARFGAREWPRGQFERQLTLCIGGPGDEPAGDWTYHPAHWRHLGLGEPAEPASVPPRKA
jgi:leucyl/phenylalanyl-tRNA---protein transferase